MTKSNAIELLISAQTGNEILEVLDIIATDEVNEWQSELEKS